MALVAMALCSVVAVIGAVGVVSPTTLVAFAGSLQSQSGLYVAAAFRVILGVALVLAARASRAPRTLRVVGVVTVVAGLLTPFFGLDRFRDIIQWWSAQSPAVMRIWAAVALAFGGLLAYLLTPKSRRA